MVKFIASAIGSPTNPTKLSNTFKSVNQVSISSNTIDKYLGYLRNAFMIEKAERYDIKGRKYIGTLPKYYFTDMGLRNVILGLRQLEENHIMENIIYNELRYRGFRVDVGVVEVYGRNSTTHKTTKTSYEVDFIATKGNLKYYIQSAFAMSIPEKQEQEQRFLRSIPDSFTKIIVVRDDKKPRHDENGFVIVGVKQFLLDQVLL